jgi:enoyl-CoA hydratase/carnithine racemase
MFANVGAGLKPTPTKGIAFLYHFLRYQTEQAVAVVTLARPEEENRVSPGLAAELREVCRATLENREIYVLVLTGSEAVFSVGREPLPADVAVAPAPARLAWLEQLRVADALASLPIPVVVAINGDAKDHGLELALAGDLRIAVEAARFGLTDLTRVGSFPWDGGTQRLPRLVGPAWANDLILTSRIIDAHQAKSIGLVNRVTEAGNLLEKARQLAEQIASGGPVAAWYAKEAISKGIDLSLPQGLRLEADLNIILQSTADRAEGLRSFAQKRAPRFTGR